MKQSVAAGEVQLVAASEPTVHQELGDPAFDRVFLDD
jgi:hypothetical protein